MKTTKELNTYYRDQLARIKNPKSEYAPTLVINHESGKTNHLSLNDESATEIVKWLSEHYNTRPSKPENTHLFVVKYQGPTNTRGSRVKITSERFYTDKNVNQSVTISYDYKFDNALEIAEKWLSDKGFEIVSHAEGKNCYYVMSSTFKPLKGE